MQIIKGKISKYRHQTILVFLGMFYFLVLLRYYLIDYHVPDFMNYFNMALRGVKAQDGFSSLFLWFAAFTACMPTVMAIFSLLLMAIAMVNISFFIKSLFQEGDLYYYISIVVLYSCCAFYYFYGKIFYDFPFTAFTYSVCLLVAQKMYSQLEKGSLPYKTWFELCAWNGFLLSWKPYNVFCITGLGLLMLGRENSRKFIFSILKSVKKISFSLFLFISGYVIGNYNLLIDPKATFTGIRAYEASFEFKQFLLSKSRIIWDHVNDLPFNISVMLLLTVVVLMFIMPIVFKKFCYLFISIFMTSCLYFYIENFSPGYAWHGFTIGLFIVTFVAFFLSDVKPADKVNWKNIVIEIAVGIQVLNCFTYYIPLQTQWHSRTEEAIAIMEEKESEIYADVVTLLNKTDDSYYMIDGAVKRYKPVAVSATSWNDINVQNTYFAATNYIFLDPLEATNYFDWMKLKQSERHSTDPLIYEFVIWIIPDCFKLMGDIADIHLYDDKNVVDQIHGDGYTVYLYRMY